MHLIPHVVEKRPNIDPGHNLAQLLVAERVEAIQNPVLHLAELAVFVVGGEGRTRKGGGLVIRVSHGFAGAEWKQDKNRRANKQGW